MTARKRNWKGTAVRLTIVVVVGLAVCELAFRWLLFSPSASGLGLAQSVRRPALFGGVQDSDLYWELQDQFLPEERRARDPAHDALLGWTSPRFKPQTYEHEWEARVGDRGVILFFGDSYVQCVTPPGDCFENLFEGSDAAEDYALLNYGVGGYGVDQMYLLMQRALERFADRDPIVLVGLMLDGDLDRAGLRFRCWPKPQLELRDGRLVPGPGPVPTRAEYFERERPFARSMLWAAFEHQWQRRFHTPTLAERAVASGGETELRARAILRAMIDETDRRGLRRMFVLFWNDGALREPRSLGWRDACARQELTQRGVPFVDVAAQMLRLSGGKAEAFKSWYGTGRAGGHYNAEGNRIAFEVILAGLRADFGVGDGGVLPRVERIDAVVSPGKAGFARFHQGLAPPFDDPIDERRLSLRVARGGPTEAHYELGGRAREFIARAHLHPLSGERGGSVELTLLGDGEVLFQGVIRGAEAPSEVRVDLTGRRALQIRAADAGDGCKGDWLVLAAPEFVYVPRGRH